MTERIGDQPVTELGHPAHPSPWAFITHQQVGSELIELTHASEAVLLVAALKFDEQGQEDETREGAEYYRALADACRCIIRAQRAVDVHGAQPATDAAPEETDA